MFRNRILSVSVFLYVCLVAASTAAQIVGQNVNMISGTKWPGGDPFLQRQNEPTIAVSSRNPLHLLAAANDYRTVDLPVSDALPNLDQMTGDAWLGIFKSFDGGATWQSVLLPGFPQDISTVGMQSPLKGLSAASDAVMRSGAGGLFAMSGIAFNRSQNTSAVFVTRFMDLNNKENGDATVLNASGSYGKDPVRYVDTRVLDTGNSGQFLDKPWIVLDAPRGNTTCTINVPQNGTNVAQTIPAGNIYVVWSKFVGNTDVTVRTKLYVSHSTDCGNTYSTPVMISQTYPINQGAQIAIDPVNGYVYIAWRQFASSNAQDAILVAKSTDGGNTWTKGNVVVTLPAFSLSSPTASSFFDEGTTGASIRTNAFPAIAVADSRVTGTGTVYVAWSQRGSSQTDPGSARIMLASSPDGINWSGSGTLVDDAAVADDSAVADNIGPTYYRGHQFMPSMTFTQGKLMLFYYDVRLDHTKGFFTAKDNTGSFLPIGGKFYNEMRNVVPGTAGLFDPLGDIYNSFLSDYTLASMFTTSPHLMNRRHTIEGRMAQMDFASSAQPGLTYATVTQYKFGTPNDTLTASPLEQLQVNPPNLPLFQQGSVPFLGDYLDIAGAAIINKNGQYQWNTLPVASAVAYATWTTNQNVVPPLDGDWTHYTPPSYVDDNGTITSIFDPTQTRPTCAGGQEGMRNQDIYSSRITQGLAVSSPQNVKPFTKDANGNLLQRAFVILVQNFKGGCRLLLDGTTSCDHPRSFRLTIANQPAGGFASWVQEPNPVPNPPPSPLPTPVVTTMYVTIQQDSGVGRTVFAASTNTFDSITVNVAEIDPLSHADIPGGLTAFVVLNGDPTSPQLIEPDGSSVDIGTIEIYTPGMQNPTPINPTPINPTPINPTPINPTPINSWVSNPTPINPTPINPTPINPTPINGDIANPTPINPTPINADLANTAVMNPTPINPTPINTSITNVPVTDATYTVTNTGNTTAAYNLKLFKNPNTTVPPLQVIVSKTYLTPASYNCSLYGQQQTVVLSNLPSDYNQVGDVSTLQNPTPINPTPINSTLPDSTFSLAPGDTALISVRGLNVYCHRAGEGTPSDNRCNDTNVPPGAIFMEDVMKNVVPVVFAQAGNTNVSGPPAPSFTAPLFLTANPQAATTSIVGLAYTAVTFSGLGGTTPYSWTLTGTLPPGLSICSGGNCLGQNGVLVISANSVVLSGTPTTAGTYTFTVALADSLQPQPRTTSATYTITVANPTLIYLGSTSDPTGDALAEVANPPDLTSASISIYNNNTAVLEVHFAAGTFASSTSAEFLLDTDQNPLTGSPGVDAGCTNDASTMGTDYFVVLNSAFANYTAGIFKANGNVCNQFTQVGTASVTPLVDGMRVTVPWNLIGGKGLMNFKLTDAANTGAGTFTGVLDYMPDVGLPPAQTVAAVPQ